MKTRKMYTEGLGLGNPPPLLTGWLILGRCHPTHPSLLGGFITCCHQCHTAGGKISSLWLFAVTWMEVSAAHVSCMPERVPAAFGSLDSSGGVQLFPSCEPHACVGWGLLLSAAGWGLRCLCHTLYPLPQGPTAQIICGRGALLPALPAAGVV